MRQEADNQGLDADDRRGGLIFDEMSIQEDLVATHKGTESFFTGQVDLGEHGNQLSLQRKGKSLKYS